MSPAGTGSRSSGLSVTTRGTAGSEWDDLVRGAPGASFCHLQAWHSILSEVMGHEVFALRAHDADGRLEGVLPLVRVRSLLFGHLLVSMPFLNYGGPVGTAAARTRLAEAALELARGEAADLLELRSRAGEDGAAWPEGLVDSSRKVAVVLPLPDDPETLWREGIRSKVRSQIRRPMKAGLEVRFGPDEVAPFHSVFSRHMRDLGTPVLPKRFFAALPDAFGEDVTFACIYRDGTPVAGGCGFHFGEEFEITWASALREHSRVAPNMLLYWRMIEAAIARGTATFNFGRCTPGGGTHRFKLQWGGHDEGLPWRSWSPDGVRATPNPEQGRYALAVAIWRRLPTAVTDQLGPRLARWLP